MKEKITNFLKTGILVALLVAGAGVFAQNWVGPEGNPDIYPPINTGPEGQIKTGGIYSAFFGAFIIEAEQEICLGTGTNRVCIEDWDDPAVGGGGSGGGVGYQIVSEEQTLDQFNPSVVVSCPGSMKVTGGGCNMISGGFQLTELHSHPNSESSYYCGHDGGSTIEITAYAICIEP